MNVVEMCVKLCSVMYSAFGKSLCTYIEVLEVMSTSVYTGLNPNQAELNSYTLYRYCTSIIV
jgi:hypothetical protein